MDKNEICQRLTAVCQALDNMTVTGVMNASNLTGSYKILEEIVFALQNPKQNPEVDKKEESKT